MSKTIQPNTKEIKGQKWVRVPDYTSAAAHRSINYAYLEHLPVSDLLWFLENCLELLKKKTVKVDLPESEETELDDDREDYNAEDD